MQQIVKLWTPPQQRSRQIIAPKFTMHQVSLVDTENIQDCWATQRGCMKQFLCKMAVNQLATGRYMKRMRFWPSDNCPRCMSPNKTTLHVLQCPAAQPIVQEKIASLVQNLQHYLTKPELLQGIMALYNTFLDESTTDTTPLTDTSSLPSNELSIKHQLQLPLLEFVQGRLVGTWHNEQAKFLQRIQSRRSANRWTQILIHEIWQLYFSLWIHRNEAYHSDPATQNQIQQLRNLNQEIRRQSAIGLHGIPPADRRHFTYIKLAQLLKKQLHYKQQWLHGVTQARQSSHQTEQTSQPK